MNTRPSRFSTETHGGYGALDGRPVKRAFLFVHSCSVTAIRTQGAET